MPLWSWISNFRALQRLKSPAPNNIETSKLLIIGPLWGQKACDVESVSSFMAFPYVCPTALHSDVSCPRSSCEDRCGMSAVDDRSMCSCDIHCQSLGDCCVDFSTKCSSLATFYVKNQYSTSMHIALRRDISPINTNATASASEAYLTTDFRQIISCPESSSPSVQEKCTQLVGETFDLGLIIPVCHPKNQLVFANKYCAYCNGYHIKDLVSLELLVGISSACEEHSIAATGKTNVSLDRVVQECTNSVIPYITKPCLDSVYRNRAFYSTYSPMCEYYLNPVVDISTSVVSRNKHCLASATGTECFDGEWPHSHVFDMPPGVNGIISLDSSGIPVLHSQVSSPSETSPGVFIQEYSRQLAVLGVVINSIVVQMN